MQTLKIRHLFSKISLCLLVAFIFGFHHTAYTQIKRGEKFMQQGAYAEAIKPLKKDFYGKDRNIAAGVLLAKCYYQLREYQEAAEVMSRISLNELSNPDDVRFATDVHIANENYSDAYLEIIQLLSTDQSDTKTYLWLDKISNLLEWDSLPNGSLVEPVKGINSIYNDYAPYVSENKELWFVSDLSGIQTVFPASYDNRGLHLYYKTKPKINDNTEVNKPIVLLKNRDYYFHDGPITEWKRENKYVLTLRDIDAVNGKIGLYFSSPSGKNESLIPFKYNENYNTGHATFTRDGTRMIFSSDRPGGYGQMDLWYCDWIDGKWTEPINFGPFVNTPFNEVFPTYKSGRVYFSSDRVDMGYGALDIYYTSESRGFNKIYNLRSPINGPYDDFAITFLNANQGYFSSNRKPGVGGDDIYTFTTQSKKIRLGESYFEFADASIPKDTKLEIFDSRDSLVATVNTVENNVFKVANLESGEQYSMKSENAHIPKDAKLKLVSASGTGMATYHQEANKSYNFELIPPEEWAEVKKDSEKSYSVTHTVNGKIIVDNGAKTEGIPVALKSSEGVVLSKSKTTTDGWFTIESVAMGEKYIIETENMDVYHEIDIYGESGAITQSIVPTGNNRFSYTRAAAPAMWMETTEISIPNVFAIVPNLSLDTNEHIVMYDGEDNKLIEPEIDSDGFMKLGTMHTGKAYRLSLPNRDLHRDDKLVIIGASGDTSQTVRPFDANNYFFEYLIYKDYGQAESDFETETEIIALNADSESETYKAHILNFDLPESTPFILRSTNGEYSDTLYSDSNGVINMYNLNKDLEYELELINSAFVGNKKIEIYNSNNELVYEGTSEGKKMFKFHLLEPEDHTISKLENEDLSAIKINLTESIESRDAEQLEMAVHDSKLRSYKAEILNFDLPENTPFILRSANGELIDTLYSDSKGVINMDHLNENLEYELELINTTFESNKEIAVFYDDDKLIYTGASLDEKLFKFPPLDPENYIISKQENEDLSVLKLNFTGRIISRSTTPIAITVSDNRGLKLGSSYSTAKGEFLIKDIKPSKSYVVSIDNTDPDAALVVKIPSSLDSLHVKRNKDGNFYVNLTDPKQKEIILVDENKAEVSVKEGSRFSLPNVYYGFNSYYLKLESRKSVDKLITLLKDNPELRVEIQSHTDSRGPANYNNLLSQRRADAVVKYITEAGIKESRLVAIGKGENELANKCKDGVTCSEEEHAANRRTEFIILGKGDKL